MTRKTLALALFVGFMFAATLGKAQETVLGRFQGTNGAIPGGGLIADAAGNLYGATGVGLGQSQNGLIYELVAPTAPGDAWTEVVLYRFTKETGSMPSGGLIFDAAGNLYGTTTYGGTATWGSVYELSPPNVSGGTWTLNILYSFLGGNDGKIPNGGLIFDTAGNLYGSTSYGGVCNAGTAYKLSPPASGGSSWTETLLHTFTGSCKGYNENDGLYPSAGLLLA
jgi:hypothetical protein